MVVNDHSDLDGRIGRPRKGEFLGFLIQFDRYAPSAWRVYFSSVKADRSRWVIGEDVGDFLLLEDDVDLFLGDNDVEWPSPTEATLLRDRYF